MATVKCIFSGLTLKVSYFPVKGTTEYYHPIFTQKQKHLLQYAHALGENKLSKEDVLLLSLALLHSTELVEFRTPVFPSDIAFKQAAANVEHIIKLVGRINIIQTPAFKLPKLVISRQNCELTNLKSMLQTWEDNYQDFLNGHRQDRLRVKLEEREQTLQRLIKDPYKEPRHYAKVLSGWAELVGGFPADKAEKWKAIICKCTRPEDIFEVSQSELSELITYCEDNILADSIYGFTLMQVLREGERSKSTFLGISLEDMEATYKLLPVSQITSPAKEQVPTATANQGEVKKAPRESDFASKIEYMRAKLAYLSGK